MTAAVLDFFDGWVARVTRRTSDLGEYLDMHWDGFGVMVACLLLIQYGQAPIWYILVGLARYLFVFGIWLRQRWGWTVYPLLPSRIRRGLAGSQMGFIAVILLPVFTPPATLVAATLFMIPFSIAFLRDWLTVSGVIKAAAPDRENSMGLARLWSGLRSWLPSVLRIGVVVLLAVIIASEMRAPDPDLTVLLVGFVALVLVGLGALGRIAALGAMLMCGFILREAPFNGLYWALLLVGTGMFLTGTGRYSLWKPEDWLIFHRAGEANRPH
jgi:CDP-diacylglycerol--glycerol-3-phosphate 3-phosphatidyltransferase